MPVLMDTISTRNLINLWKNLGSEIRRRRSNGLNRLRQFWPLDVARAQARREQMGREARHSEIGYEARKRELLMSLRQKISERRAN